MSLKYDLISARDICRELEQSGQEFGVEFASALLSGLGKENWVKMLQDNRADFLAYLRATPSQRKRKAAWKGDRMQVALSVGGACCLLVVLFVILKLPLRLRNNGAARHAKR